MPQGFDWRTLSSPQAPSASLPRVSSADEPASTWQLLLDALNKPGSMLRGGINAGVKGENVLKGVWRGAPQWAGGGGEYVSSDELLQQAGMEPGKLRTVAGFAGDLLLDPLNALALAPKVGAKAVQGVSAGLRGIGNVVEAAGKSKTLPKIFSKSAAGVDDLLTKITPYRELRNVAPYKDLRTVTDLKLRSGAARASAEVEQLLKAPLKATRKAKLNPETAMQEAMLAADVGKQGALVVPEVRALAEAGLQHGQQRFARESAADVLGTQRPNYIPRYYKEEPVLPTVRPGHRVGLGEPAFTKERTLESFGEAMAKGHEPEFNLVTALTKRGQSGERAIALNEHFKDLLTKPEFKGTVVAPVEWVKDATGVVTPKAPAGWKQFDSAFLPPALRAQLKGVAFKPEVATDLQRLLEVGEKQAQGLAKAFDAVQGVWKTSATVLRPAFHARNMLSNLYISMAAGMSPVAMTGRYHHALRLMLDQTDPLYQSAKRLGVIGTEFGVVGDLTKPSATLGRLTHPARAGEALANAALVVPRGLAAGGRKIGTVLEDSSRLALWLDQLAKGKSAEQASLHVNKWLINYAGVTEAEKGLRRVFPFYVWGRRIVPLLAETAISNPALLAAQGKGKEALERLVPEGQRVPEAGRPEYVRQADMFQFPDKGKQGETYYGNVGLPGPDLNLIPAPGGSGPVDVLQELLGRLSPAKIAAEIPLNKSFGTGADIAPSGNRLELRPATGIARILIKAGLGDMIGAKMYRGEWQVPAAINHTLSQTLPVAEAIGKGIGSRAPEATGEVDSIMVGGKPIARWLWNFLTVPGVAKDTPQAQRYRRQEARKNQRLERRQGG